MRINYSITFLSDWHAGSGLSSGADADSVVIKDSSNLPYLPGKTIKGLLKDVFTDFAEVQTESFPKDFIKINFGEYDKENKISDMGSLFFSNAALNSNEQEAITKEMSEFLYYNIASTTIDNGVAKVGSLRTMQVCVPVILEGHIDGVNDNETTYFEQAFKYLRHLGSNRNRGLGRCKFEIKTN